MMRYLIFSMILFIIGCSSDNSYQVTETEKRLHDLYLSIEKLRSDVQRLTIVDDKFLKTAPTPELKSVECVMYKVGRDTHGSADNYKASPIITITVSGYYKILLNNGNWLSKGDYFKAGHKFTNVDLLIRNTCPSYEDFK